MASLILFHMLSRLDQLDENVGEALRVGEGDERPVSAPDRRRSEHIRSPFPQRLESGPDVIDFEGDMVQPAPSFLDKLADRRIGRGGFKEFYARIAQEFD